MLRVIFMVKTMLNTKEQKYFNSLKDYILKLFSVHIGVYSLDHKMLSGDETILGCCHKMKNDKGKLLRYIITIDENYIKACYYGRQTAYSQYSDNQLIETICHELAHLKFWGHNSDHKELTNFLYNTVIESLTKNF